MSSNRGGGPRAPREREKERLESEITTRRTEWEEEVRTTERDRKEVEDQVRKQRQREMAADKTRTARDNDLPSPGRHAVQYPGAFPHVLLGLG